MYSICKNEDIEIINVSCLLVRVCKFDKRNLTDFKKVNKTYTRKLKKSNELTLASATCKFIYVTRPYSFHIFESLDRVRTMKSY